MHNKGTGQTVQMLQPRLDHFMALGRLSHDKAPINLVPQVTECTGEPPRGKTNNVVSEQVPHKPACTSTEKS